jgi:hypothetical protein
VIEIRNAAGELIRRDASDDARESPEVQKIQITEDWVPMPEPPASTPGAHRFLWNLRYRDPKEIHRSRHVIGPTGIWAPPGRYTVRLTAAGQTLEKPLDVSKDPRIPASDADLIRQFELARGVEALRVRVAVAAGEAEALRTQAEALRGKASGAAAPALAAFRAALDALAGPADTPGNELFDETSLALTSLRRLSGSLALIQEAVESADTAPTPDAVEGFRRRSEIAEQGLAAWRQFRATEVPRVNGALAASGLPALK